MIGHIKWFSPLKNYGFIRCDETEKDYFFHGSELSYDYVPVNGSAVSFTPEEGTRGLKAVNIRALVITDEE